MSEKCIRKTDEQQLSFFYSKTISILMCANMSEYAYEMAKAGEHIKGRLRSNVRMPFLH